MKESFDRIQKKEYRFNFHHMKIIENIEKILQHELKPKIENQTILRVNLLYTSYSK